MEILAILACAERDVGVLVEVCGKGSVLVRESSCLIKNQRLMVFIISVSLSGLTLVSESAVPLPYYLCPN